MPIPSNVLDGPTAISTTLHAGDVLYMPRGFVHQAQTCKDELSFHITIAIATHDWTLAGIFSSGTEHVLSRVVDFRKSILPFVPSGLGAKTAGDNCTKNDNNHHEVLQQQIDRARSPEDNPGERPFQLLQLGVHARP